MSHVLLENINNFRNNHAQKPTINHPNHSHPIHTSQHNPNIHTRHTCRFPHPTQSSNRTHTLVKITQLQL